MPPPTRTGICRICRLEKLVFRSWKSGRLTCRTCYQRQYMRKRHRDPSMHKRCVDCGRRRYVAHWAGPRKPLCGNCYIIRRANDPSTHEKCITCRNMRPVAARTASGKARCATCHLRDRYHDTSTHEACSKCGDVRPVKTRTAKGGPVCENCYLRRQKKLI